MNTTTSPPDSGGIQEGNHLHYLADRASIAGTFNEADLRYLDQAFPVLMKQMELMLASSELTPHIQRCITLHAKGLICEADTLHTSQPAQPSTSGISNSFM